MKLKYTKIVVYLTDGCDKVNIFTDYPCPFVPTCLPSQPPLHLSFETTKNKAIEYCKNTFGVMPEVRDIRIS